MVSLSGLPVIENLLLGATTTMRSLLTARAMNLTRTARALHVHPNTLRYRLRRIRERTGRDPHTFQGVVDLMCLIALLSDAGHEGDAPQAASPSR